MSTDHFKTAQEIKIQANECKRLTPRLIEADGVQIKFCGQIHGPKEIQSFDWLPSLHFCEKMGKN